MTGGGGLRAELVARARSGDAAALERLLTAVPCELSPSIRRAERDTTIRQMVTDLSARHPGASKRRVAAMVAAAGHRIEAGHAALDGSEFRSLTEAEARDLADRVRRVLAWAPARRDGGAWPAPRQIIRIVCHTSLLR